MRLLLIIALLAAAGGGVYALYRFRKRKALEARIRSLPGGLLPGASRFLGLGAPSGNTIDPIDPSLIQGDFAEDGVGSRSALFP